MEQGTIRREGAKSAGTEKPTLHHLQCFSSQSGACVLQFGSYNIRYCRTSIFEAACYATLSP